MSKNKFNTPWRIEEKPKGWGSSTVIFDSKNDAVHYNHSAMFFIAQDRWEFVVDAVNNYELLKEALKEWNDAFISGDLEKMNIAHTKADNLLKKISKG